MNLLCPNCQNPLTVPEQYAGQLMKCPLCSNNFTVPALPAASTLSLGEPGLAPQDSEPHKNPEPVHSAADHEPEGTYGLHPEESGLSPRPLAVEAPAVIEPEPKRTPPPPPPPPPRPKPVIDGYTHTTSLTLSPQVLPWIAPAAMILVFFLSFFTWVGAFPGGYGVYTQNAWYAAFGTYYADPVYGKETANEKSMNISDDDKPAVAVLLIFFVLLLIPVVAVVCLAAAWPYVHTKFNFPKPVLNLEPWRWLIATGATLLLLLLVLFQVLLGFSLEDRFRAAADKATAEIRKRVPPLTPEESKAADIRDGINYGKYVMQRTIWLRLSVSFLLVAFLGSLATHWILQRGSRPLPTLELKW